MVVHGDKRGIILIVGVNSRRCSLIRCVEIVSSTKTHYFSQYKSRRPAVAKSVSKAGRGREGEEYSY